MTDHTPIVAALKSRRAELVGDLMKIEDALDDPMPKDWEDQASERQGDQVLEALGTHDRDELRLVVILRHRASAIANSLKAINRPFLA